jgi:signal transduction histidine kinase
MLAALIHYSGGVENPFAFYFIFHVIVAGALLSPIEAWLQAAIASVLFCGVVVLEHVGLLAHYHLPGLAPADLYRNSLVVTANVAAFASTIGLAAFTGISISHLVREKQQESRSLIGQLERAYWKLDELGRSKSRHMRRVSHELRAPLGAIQNLLAMLKDTLTGKGRSEERNLADRAAKRAGQALKLVDDLLILARSQDAKFTVTMKEIYLPQTIDDVVGMLRPRADSEGVTLTVDVPQGLPPVLGDAEGIQQLFVNLISNAIKYTPRGGQVSIKAAAQDDRVVATVADTGIGISDEDLPHVFDEFYRGKNARQFAEQGTGLGLSIVKGIADAHGADLQVRSEVGRGTSFELSIPKAGTDAAGWR